MRATDSKAARRRGDRGRGRSSPRPRSPSIRSSRRATSPRPRSGCSYVTLTPEFQSQAGAAERAGHRRSRRDRGRRCRAGTRRAQLRRQRLLSAQAGVRRRRPLLRLAGGRLRHASSRCCSAPATARRSAETRLGDGKRARAATGHRDHHRIDPGAGDALLGPRGDARQARLRGAHLRRPGPGSLRHLAARVPTSRKGSPRRRASRSSTAPRTRSTSCSRARPRRTTRARAVATPTATSPPSTRRSRNGGSRPGSTRRSTRSATSSTPSRIGIAGHSLGAGAVSYVGQVDPRVDAIVAWDNLRASSSMSPGGARRLRRAGVLPGRPRPGPTSRRSPSRRSGSPTTTASSRPRTCPIPTRRMRTRPSSTTSAAGSTRCRSTSAAAPTSSPRSSPG